VTAAQRLRVDSASLASLRIKLMRLPHESSYSVPSS